MKKLLSLITVLCMLFALCACGDSSAASSPTAAPAEETSAETEAAPAGEAASSGRTFIMGIDPEYPPFSFLGDDGNYTGFDVEICQAVCDHLGWDLEIFSVNWDEKLVQLDSMECDCVWSGMTILDSMKEAGYNISEPYFDNTQVLVVKEDSGFASSADLAGKVVAVQLGTSGESLLNGDLADLAGTFENVITCDSFLKCFTELEGNAVDAVFVDMPVAANYVAAHEGLTIIDEDLGAEQYGIAFRADDAELCATVDAAVQELVENGTYAEIASKPEYEEIVNNLLFLNK
ncbi:MAG: transporter substrate-binding domain-containing protein [Lachnospiraceae bacterium]|nr:transporter substrate-binding domain-containing protein [Lachnospiraceae bacterium]